MKIARFRTGKRVGYGVLTGGEERKALFSGQRQRAASARTPREELVEIRGSIYTRFRMTDTRYSLSDVKLLPPTDPTQLWGPGPNFAEHLEFAGSVYGDGGSAPPAPLHPEPWRKGRNALTGPDDPIIIPKDSGGDVHYEGEVVAVIGKECRRVTPTQASKFILGYTCGNDVSERSWQKSDWTLWRAKGSDSFAPVGPWIETELDPQDLELVVQVNGREVQRVCTKDMLFSFAEIVSYISQQVTLHPGDLVYSGTNGTTSALKPGDLVEVSVRGIGVLRNPVVAEFDGSRDRGN